MLPKTTINETGSKTVWIKNAGADKERMTVMLLASSDGTKKPPFVVVKTVPSKDAAMKNENILQRQGFGKTLWKEIEAAMREFRMSIYGNDNGWFTKELTLKWLNYNFGMNTSPLLLLLDEFSGHLGDEVTAAAARMNVHIIYVPAGLTCVCQPADVSWMKPFKANLRLLWTRQIMQQLRDSPNEFRLTKPLRKDVFQWIVESWGYLTADAIKSGFNRYLNNESTAEIEFNEAELTSNLETIFNAYSGNEIENEDSAQ